MLLELLGQPDPDEAAAASSRTDDFYANLAYAGSTRRATDGAQAATATPSAPVASPDDEDTFGAVVESALTALPVDQRLEALGRVQARLMTDLVQALVLRATEAGFDGVRLQTQRG